MKRVLATRPEVQAAEKATHPTVVHLRKPRRETPSAPAGFALVVAAGAGAAGAGFAAAAAETPLTAFDRGAGAACTPPGPVAAVMGGVGSGGVDPAAVPAGCAAAVSGGRVGGAPTAAGSAPGAGDLGVEGSFSSAIQLLVACG